MVIIGDNAKSDTYWREVLIEDGRLFVVPCPGKEDNGPARITLTREQLTELLGVDDVSTGNWLFTADSLPAGSS